MNPALPVHDGRRIAFVSNRVNLRLATGNVGVMAAIQGLEIVPVPFSDVTGHNRTVDRRFFRLVQQFNVVEESEMSHAHH